MKKRKKEKKRREEKRENEGEGGEEGRGGKLQRSSDTNTNKRASEARPWALEGISD